MNNSPIAYIGEHAWAGQLGHALALISLVAAALSTIAYFLGAERKDAAWTRLGRLGFRAHSVAVLGIVSLLFIMLFNHWFEFDYVWKHSNLQMPMKYIASCFWEGQEGSFLLWTFWHVVLGNVLISRFRVKPGMTNPKYWSVSQMDNFNHCQCAQCHRTDSIEGSPSGSILRFANAVADSFPDKVISTLAYQYSRTALKVTKPRPNVNIMLCSIEEDRSRPIASRDQPGSFTADLREWSSLTQNIIVWDYVINFSHLVMPFPNWKVLQPNLQLFRDNGVPMVFEQGLSSPGGEMPEFRTYLLAKLLWNPDVNVDSLRTHFMNAFYGDAGVYIDKYTRLLEEELDKSGKALTLYEHPQSHKDGYLSPENIAKYKMLFNSAEAAAWEETDTMFQWRVEDARLGIMYAELEIARAMPHAPNGLFEKDSAGQWQAKPYYTELLETFALRAKRQGHVLLHETRLPPDEYFKEFSAHLEHGAVNHLALGKPISFVEPPDARYTASRPDALVDGFRASNNYQFGWQGWYGKDMVATIDLGSVRSVGGLEVAFLQDQQSWIFLPSSVRWDTSTDGEHWELGQESTDTTAAAKGPLQALGTGWSISCHGKAARYIRVTAKNLGDLPAWHGSKGQCWLFCDEIMVR